MRKFISLSLCSALLGGLASTSALAGGGGMGDVGKFMREKNAICDQQRRGEAPPYPSQCLPELPVTPVYQDQRRY